MTLIEQLQKRLVAVEAHGKWGDVRRVLNVAFPEDNTVPNLVLARFYISNSAIPNLWAAHHTLPEGMKAVHIDEFIKELDGEGKVVTYTAEEARMLRERGDNWKSKWRLAEDELEELRDMNTLAKANGELRKKLEAEKELRIKAEGWEESSGAWERSFRASNKEFMGLKTQIKELQPFDRGAEGWGYIGHNWSKEKYIYIGRHGYKGHAVDSDRFGLKYVSDFTTENPHKKETVWESDIHSNNWDKWSKKGAIFIRRRNTIIVHSICTRDNTAYFRFTQIGDDLQSKFDDETNLKYIDLGK